MNDLIVLVYILPAQATIAAEIMINPCILRWSLFPSTTEVYFGN